jgi:hypothetical protein
MPDFKQITDKQLAAFEALRQLGFSSDDIYAGTANGGEVFTFLRVEGKQFNMNFPGTPRVDDAAYAAAYKAAASWWNDDTTSEAEKRGIYRKEFPVGGSQLYRLAKAVQAKGITVPKFPARLL